jgi:hypothetical protein
MSVFGKTIVPATILLLVGQAVCCVGAQETAAQPSVLRIQRSTTTSETGFPAFLGMYHVLDGAKSPTEALSLTGTISLKNFDPNFSEVLFLLVYWQGTCPADDINLTEAAGFLWSDILKNPTQSDSELAVNLNFPHPLPMTGCVGLYYGGGTLVQGKVTMSANLELRYQAASANPNTVLDLSGEYCFGQDWGCQNATGIDGEGFAVPIVLPAGHLVEIYGDISDSAFDGTKDFGPIPTGPSWGSINDFYLLPGGCGIFARNINSQGFPNPAPLSTLHTWLPPESMHLASIPMVDRIAKGETGKVTLQSQVENVFPVPVKVNAGDCMLVIYGRTGNGATDNETQIHALLAP